MSARVNTLAPRLSRRVWLLEAGTAANAFGNGFVDPFLLIYLHNVRGLSLASGGVALAVYGSISIASGPFIGGAIDRVGSKLVLVVALTVAAASALLYLGVHSFVEALLVAGLSGIGRAGVTQASSTVLADLTTDHQRVDAFSVQRIASNVGIGLGAAAGGLVAVSSHPSTYDALFVVDAASFVAFAICTFLVDAPPVRHERQLRGRSAWSAIRADRAFVRLLIVDAVAMGTGFASLQDLLPAFAKNFCGISERGVGLIFLTNCSVVVVAQLPVARFMEGRRRLAAYRISMLIWATAWLLVLAGAVELHGDTAAFDFAGAVALIGMGECLWGAVRAPLIADMAPDGLRGRYLSLSVAGIEGGWALARALGGVGLSVAPVVVWLGAAAVAGTAAVSVGAIAAHLPAEVARNPVRAASTQAA